MLSLCTIGNIVAKLHTQLFFELKAGPKFIS